MTEQHAPMVVDDSIIKSDDVDFKRNKKNINEIKAINIIALAALSSMQSIYLFGPPTRYKKSKHIFPKYKVNTYEPITKNLSKINKVKNKKGRRM